VFVRDRKRGVTRRVSVSSNGLQGDANSYGASISADGRYVAFVSGASTLVADDTNGTFDVFVRDRLRGRTRRVSVSTSGLQGDGDSFAPSISADGRYVAFASRASTLVAHDTNGMQDLLVRDRQLGVTRRVSISTAGLQADGDSENPAISADGRYVAFDSVATDLVAHDTNGSSDVFVRSR
jgi:Tol biopolymer transport system component